MSCQDFRTLLNREVDGRTTPEEEALLMQHVGGCPVCAQEQQELRRLHQAFLGLRQAECPPGLGQRIADRVLARAAAGASVIPFASRRQAWTLARNAAAVLLTVTLAGVGGWFLGQDGRKVAAEPTSRAAQVAREQAIWVGTYGLTPETASRILQIKADFRAERERTQDPIRQAQLHDQEVARILQELSSVPRALEAYRRDTGIADDEFRRLMRLNPR